MIGKEKEQGELSFLWKKNILVSYKWLKELVDIDVPSQELAEKCQLQGSR